MQNLKKQYRDLEMKVMQQLRTAIERSVYESKFVNEKAIKVNISNYKELTIINDRLTFLDANGLHYSVYADCSLEDLIDLINTIKVNKIL